MVLGIVAGSIWRRKDNMSCRAYPDKHKMPLIIDTLGKGYIQKHGVTGCKTSSGMAIRRLTHWYQSNTIRTSKTPQIQIAAGNRHEKQALDTDNQDWQRTQAYRTFIIPLASGEVNLKSVAHTRYPTVTLSWRVPGCAVSNRALDVGTLREISLIHAVLEALPHRPRRLVIANADESLVPHEIHA